MNSPKIFIAFLLLVSLANAQGIDCNSVDLTCSEEIECAMLMNPAVVSLIALAFGINIILIALAYMVGSIVKDRRLGFWAKHEVSQLVISVMILFILVLSAGVLCGVMSGFISGDNSPISCSILYLDSLSSSGKIHAKDLVSTALENHISATNWQFSGSFGLIVMGNGKGEAVGEQGKNKGYAVSQEMLSDTIIPLSASLKLQSIFLGLITELVFQLGIPFGIFLRVFPLTRNAGNTLLAACLGLYIVFPMIYVLSAQIYKTMPPPSFSEIGPPNSQLGLEKVGTLIPQAIFFPNLAIVVTTSFIMIFSGMLRSSLAMMEY